MLSSAKNIESSALSLELVWDASPVYWCGKIGVIDLYVDGHRLYTVEIPDRAMGKVTLPLLKCQGGSSESSDAPYPIIDSLEKAHTLSLQAGIFNGRDGNTSTRNVDGRWSRDYYLQREDTQIQLDVRSLKLGKHYQIVVTHSMKQKPGSSFWEGSTLQATAREAGGFCKNAHSIAEEAASWSSLPFS